MTKAWSNPPGGLLAAVPPVWRRPTLAPLYALGIAFVVVLLLGVIVREVSPRPPPPPPTPLMPLIRVTVDRPPVGGSHDKNQNFRIQIMAKNANPKDVPHQEWSLCLSGHPGWKVIYIPIESHANGLQCTAPVPDKKEISFTVSTN